MFAPINTQIMEVDQDSMISNESKRSPLSANSAKIRQLSSNSGKSVGLNQEMDRFSNQADLNEIMDGS